MKTKFPFKRSAMESFIFPIVTLFLLVVGVPFLIKYTSFYTTQYVFLATIGFFVVFIRIISLLNLHIKWIDILLTIPIVIITTVLLIILGILSLIIILIYPKSIYRVSYTLSLIILFVLGVNLKFEGDAPPKGSQFILVGNHTSFIDELLIVVAMEGLPWTIVFAKEIKRIPFFGKMLKGHGIPVDRDDPCSKKTAGKQIIKAMSSGKSFAIFPEGKRMRPDDFKKGIFLYPFENGAFHLASKNNFFVYPVVFSYPFFYKPRSGRWWFSPQTVTIVRLPPINTVAKDCENKDERDERIAKFGEEVWSSMNSCIGERTNGRNFEIRF